MFGVLVFDVEGLLEEVWVASERAIALAVQEVRIFPGIVIFLGGTMGSVAFMLNLQSVDIVQVHLRIHEYKMELETES